ncbi:hypothetical protein VPNG_04975 [Cytospora leucostoma]|uniref:Extracellular membrane protein CFEM domain-containing protein n=1 Tax=Cytospora leucostoma TaxID=1230097 RepID=A0A423X787_9PEZI|nr:hypothetical protein VPNG_04975 [Cytospora leucostoma]
MQISRVALYITTLAVTAMAMPTASHDNAGSQQQDVSTSNEMPSIDSEAKDPTPDECRELCNCKDLDGPALFKCITNPNRERCQDLGMCGAESGD